MSKQQTIKIFTFQNDWGKVPVMPELMPRPMSKMVAEWWRDMPSHGGWGPHPADDDSIDFNSANEAPTIKRCIPVLDSLTIGYGLVTTAEMYVQPYIGDMNINMPDCPQEEAVMQSTHPRRLERIPCLEISSHEYGQAINHPLCQKSGQRLTKVFTPWRIMTPPGYSVILTEPLNNPSPYWEIVPGVLDSDQFAPLINFMLTFKDPNFKGIIPAGTLLAQIIPFKRESWSAEIIDSEEGRRYANDSSQNIFARLNTVFRAPYKKFFWSKKEFK